MSETPDAPPRTGPRISRTPGAFDEARSAGYSPAEAERDAAMRVHLLAAAFALFSVGLFGALAPVAMRYVARQRGAFFLFHANQTLLLQGAAAGSVLLLSALGYALMAAGAGLLCFLLLLPCLAVAVLAPVMLALSARQGQWQCLPWLGERVLRRWLPILN